MESCSCKILVRAGKERGRYSPWEIVKFIYIIWGKVVKCKYLGWGGGMNGDEVKKIVKITGQMNWFVII